MSLAQLVEFFKMAEETLPIIPVDVYPNLAQYMELADLLSVRLVSKTWLWVAEKELRRRVARNNARESEVHHFQMAYWWYNHDKADMCANLPSLSFKDSELRMWQRMADRAMHGNLTLIKGTHFPEDQLFPHFQTRGPRLLPDGIEVAEEAREMTAGRDQTEERDKKRWDYFEPVTKAFYRPQRGSRFIVRFLRAWKPPLETHFGPGVGERSWILETKGKHYVLKATKMSKRKVHLCINGDGGLTLDAEHALAVGIMESHDNVMELLTQNCCGYVIHGLVLPSLTLAGSIRCDRWIRKPSWCQPKSHDQLTIFFDACVYGCLGNCHMMTRPGDITSYTYFVPRVSRGWQERVSMWQQHLKCWVKH